jgi:hypothetical protein
MIFKGKPINVGSEIELKTPKAEIVGQVISLGNELYGSHPKTITVRGIDRTVESWILETIATGDKMINLANGNTVAELIDFQLSSVPTLYFTNPGYYSNLFLENNTRVRDVTATIKLKVEETPYGYVFANRQILKVGQDITLYFPKYTFSYFEIQKIIESEDAK